MIVKIYKEPIIVKIEKEKNEIMLLHFLLFCWYFLDLFLVSYKKVIFIKRIFINLFIFMFYILLFLISHLVKAISFEFCLVLMFFLILIQIEFNCRKDWQEWVMKLWKKYFVFLWQFVVSLCFLLTKWFLLDF